MKSKILIDVDSYMSSVSLLEDGKLKEHYVEYKESNRLTGNIYRGRVVNVLQGLQTAFVDIGLTRNGFLAVGETLDHRSVLSDSGKIPQQLDVKAGDYVMVQVTKEETGAKGARLTANISLPGRYVVYLPTLDFIGVSNKISDEEERRRLTYLLEKVKPEGGGFIARTICLEAKKQEILDEIKQLKKMFIDIQERFTQSDNAVSLVHSEGGLIVRTVRDMISAHVESVVCNDLSTYEALRVGLEKINPRFKEKVQLFESDYDMSDVYGVLHEVDKLLEHKVTLPSGGTLVIDHTEALTAIDVNTGRFVGQDSHEETVFRTNMEAAVEIARQLRLRNIGGIVIIDFIDMWEQGHKDDVVEALRREMVFDRTKTRVLGMSELGLVEVTRKKTGREIGTVLLESCPYCSGSAQMPSGDYVSKKLQAQLKRLFAEGSYSGATVTMNPKVLEHIASSGFFSKNCAGEWADKRIYLVPDEKLLSAEFRVMPNKGSIISVPVTARLLY